MAWALLTGGGLTQLIGGGPVVEQRRESRTGLRIVVEDRNVDAFEPEIGTVRVDAGEVRALALSGPIPEIDAGAEEQ